MRRAAHERIDASVGAEGSPADLGGLVDLDVRNVEASRLESLCLCIGAGVLEQVEQIGRGLSWPGALVGLQDLGLSVPSGSSRVSAERNGLLAVDDVVEELVGSLEGHVLEGLGRLAHHLEVNAKIVGSCLGG